MEKPLDIPRLVDLVNNATWAIARAMAKDFSNTSELHCRLYLRQKLYKLFPVESVDRHWLEGAVEDCIANLERRIPNCYATRLHKSRVSPDPSAQRENPAQILRRRKAELCISSWEAAALRANKLLKTQQQNDVKAGIQFSATRGTFCVSIIQGILKGRNARPENCRILATVFGCEPQDLLWPTQ
jgi:hypothetical protein